MLSIIHSRASIGVSVPAVTVEIHLSGGLPALSIVGSDSPKSFFFNMIVPICDSVVLGFVCSLCLLRSRIIKFWCQD